MTTYNLSLTLLLFDCIYLKGQKNTLFNNFSFELGGNHFAYSIKYTRHLSADWGIKLGVSCSPIIIQNNLKDEIPKLTVNLDTNLIHDDYLLKWMPMLSFNGFYHINKRIDVNMGINYSYNFQNFSTLNPNRTGPYDYFIILYDQRVNYYIVNIGMQYNFKSKKKINYYLGLELNAMYSHQGGLDEVDFTKPLFAPMPKLGASYRF